MSAPALPIGGGTMDARVRAHDWSSTPLGRPAARPQALRTVLGIALGSSFPARLVWGPDFICFPNDALLRFPGTGPGALGRPFKEVWPEAWDAIGPVAARALSGEPGHFEDIPLTLERDGRPEETWWTFSYSPVFGETGGVDGVLATVHETTDRVSAERRLRFLVEVGTRLRGLADPREVTAAAVAMLGRHLGADRAGCGEVDPTGTFFTVESEGTGGGGVAPDASGRRRLDSFGAPIADELRAGRAVRVDDARADPRSRARSPPAPACAPASWSACLRAAAFRRCSTL